MIGAPLSQIRAVIKKKNADSIPSLLALASTLSSATFWIYGVLLGDPNIFYPNAIGTVLGSLQLLLKLVYPGGKKPQVFSLLPTDISDVRKGDKQ